MLLTALLVNGCKKDSTLTNLSKTETKSDRETITLEMKDGTTMHVEKINGEYIIGGDVVLTREQFNYFKSKSKQGGLVTQAVYINDLLKLWPNKTVYYKISNSINNQAILDAINYIHNTVGIIFVTRTNQNNYIDFVGNPSQGAGSSALGMIGNRQEIKLANSISYGTVVHEICHSLGMYHEQARSDRGTYINVNYGNINDDWKPQYDIVNTGVPHGSFDFYSIMLYPSFSSDAAKNGSTTPQMTRLDGTTWDSQRQYLTTGDINALNYIYNPPYYVKAIMQIIPELSYGDATYSHAEASVHFYIYDNTNRTVPKILTTPLNVNVIEQTGTYPDSFGSPPTITNTYYYVTIPAGVSSYTPAYLTNRVVSEQSFSYDGMAYAGSFYKTFASFPGFGYQQ
ncbi:hypothetical protein GCM10023149_09700 [Mucilaginibacter gynuensis]|uniref:Peptidase M12A domain-containing protein n=1 Tax=Mucilaginibacter gynuensis TaxID=1302236 RepID=A0ABP8FZ24_9SPHI